MWQGSQGGGGEGPTEIRKRWLVGGWSVMWWVGGLVSGWVCWVVVGWDLVSPCQQFQPSPATHTGRQAGTGTGRHNRTPPSSPAHPPTHLASRLHQPRRRGAGRVEQRPCRRATPPVPACACLGRKERHEAARSHVQQPAAQRGRGWGVARVLRPIPGRVIMRGAGRGSVLGGGRE